MKIEGSIAIVTGSNRGIGKSFVDKLRDAGASKIYATARSSEALNELSSLEPGRVIPIFLDVTNQESINKAVERCQDVNLLINNAGVAFYEGLIASSNLDSARTEMEVIYFGTLRMCRAFAPILEANRGGAIINVLSILARVNLPLGGSYCAAKAATLSLTQVVRAELATQGTLVVATMPATVDTEMTKEFPPPKVSPEEVVEESLRAVIDGTEEVYPGEMANAMSTRLLSDSKAVEKELAGWLPTPSVDSAKSYAA
jgi:NAD(P)-dependent dehydrogenase (short-subunit alcohol dehydrogenase family)